MTEEQLITNCEGIIRVMHGNIRRRFLALHKTNKSISQRQAIKIEEYEIALINLGSMLSNYKNRKTTSAA